jgi:hypothetical protein
MKTIHKQTSRVGWVIPFFLFCFFGLTDPLWAPSRAHWDPSGVTWMSRCLFSFFTRARLSRPFYALRATPKKALNFGQTVGWSVGWLVGWSVGRSRGSHMNVTLPLQFRHQDPPFPTILRPAGHSQNSLKFWSIGRSVGWSVGHGEVT